MNTTLLSDPFSDVLPPSALKGLETALGDRVGEPQRPNGQRCGTNGFQVLRRRERYSGVRLGRACAAETRWACLSADRSLNQTNDENQIGGTAGRRPR